MKTIYFAIDREENTTAATSLTDISAFLGYNPESLRRAFRRAEGNKIELMRGVVYKTTLTTITGRGGFMRDNRT
jgi:hypothetical protein